MVDEKESHEPAPVTKTVKAENHESGKKKHHHKKHGHSHHKKN
jgi:hypothetical protein